MVGGHSDGGPGSPTVLELTLPQFDGIAVVAFADHAAGSDGIIALAQPAATAASVAGKPFTIGVETDTPEVAGGAQYTFFDEGSAVLEAEAGLVHDAFVDLAGYSGSRRRAPAQLAGVEGLSRVASRRQRRSR